MVIEIKKSEWPDRMRLAVMIAAKGGVITKEAVLLHVEDITGFLHIMWHVFCVCSRKSYPELMRMRYKFKADGEPFFVKVEEEERCLRYGYDGK